MNAWEMIKVCIGQGVPYHKILSLPSTFQKIVCNIGSDKKIMQLRNYILENICIPQNDVYLGSLCLFDACDTDCMMNTNNLRHSNVLWSDYIRYRTFELVSKEINEAGIDGAVAEFGVFTGDFAEVINLKFPHKKLYLYDSFQGFRKDEAKKEIGKNNCSEQFCDVFFNTKIDVNSVINRLPHPENALLRIGYFPDSIEKEDYDEQFSFVSLDVDFEDSTYQGLEFFYPRLVQGGYIFIHEYNCNYLDGVHKAIERYEKKYGQKLRKVPIADYGGTVIIVK